VRYPGVELSQSSILGEIGQFLKPLLLQMPEKWETLFSLPEMQDCMVIDNTPCFNWQGLPPELKDKILVYAFSHKILYGFTKDQTVLNTPEGEIEESPETLFLLLVKWLEKTLPRSQQTLATSRAVLRS
jgi:hypothetical protein